MEKFYYSDQYKNSESQINGFAINRELQINLRGSIQPLDLSTMTTLNKLIDYRSLLVKSIIDKGTFIPIKILETCYQQVDYINDQIRQILFL